MSNEFNYLQMEAYDETTKTWKIQFVRKPHHHNQTQYIEKNKRSQAELKVLTTLALSGMCYGAVLGTFFFPGLGSMMGMLLGLGIGAGVAFAGIILRSILPRDVEKGAEKALFNSAMIFAILGALVGTIFLPGFGTLMGMGCGAGAGLIGMAVIYAAEWLVIGVTNALSTAFRWVFGGQEAALDSPLASEAPDLSNPPPRELPKLSTASTSGNEPQLQSEVTEHLQNPSPNSNL